MTKRTITRDDLISDEAFGQERKARRAHLIPTKKNRRIHVGPDVCFYFENYDTMLLQIQDMLYIERGGEQQIKDELAAYAPLVPKGDELVATVMIEIADEHRRLRTLLSLTHFERHLFLQIEDQKIYAKPEDDAERTSDDGKTSSVHFVRFAISKKLQTMFQRPETQVLLGVDHENYAHMALLSAANKQELARDF